EEDTEFRTYYGLDASTALYGPYNGKLSNSGETLTLKTSIDGDDLIAFDFSDGRGWPRSADGAGHSLVPVDGVLTMLQDGLLDYSGNWRPSAFIGGSPGASDPEPIAGLVINEIAAAPEDGNDWIELYNASSNAINLSGWYMSDDDSNLSLWAAPAIDVAPGEYISFDAESGFNQSGDGFGIGRNGEAIFLSYLPGQAGVDRVVDSVEFKSQTQDAAWGRDSSGKYWGAMEPSRNFANSPLDAPVLIDELMYHPAETEGQIGDAAEYIELYNTTSRDVLLSNDNGPWRLDGGVEFIFPANTVVPADGRLLVVSIDPGNAAEWSEFVAAYQIDPSSVLAVGPYSGNLSNHGERIALEQLNDVDPDDGSLSWGIIDEVIYYDRTPWTPDADGSGNSLQRVSWERSGNDPSNWKAGTPNPGKKSTITSVLDWMMY
ncbi:lamin tail domain-containing protein, partial [bacterium]|nr:lamin tail domain-containing protein [bacterium]